MQTSKLPIILIGIQVFDLNGMDITEKPHIISHKAYFWDFVNSPHVVHSINNDAMVHELLWKHLNGVYHRVKITCLN